MHRAARLLLVLVACLPLLVGADVLPASADEAPLGVRQPMPTTLDNLEQQLTALQKKIDELVAAASRDPAERYIEEYTKYTTKELKKTRGRVRAEKLVEFMVDSERNFQTVREPARKAILDGGRFRGDPDLSDSEKRGSQTKRAYFCLKELAPYLKDDDVDRVARKLVNDLLKEFYPQAARTNPEIRIYNQDNEDTWSAAYRAWGRFLKRQ